MIRVVRALRRGGAMFALGAVVGAGAAFAQVLLYVPTENSNQVWEYGITRSTGALSGFPTQPTNGNYPNEIAVTPNNRFMYVSDRDGVIDAFVVNYEGTLTAVPPPLARAASVRGMVIDRTGKYLYASNATENDIRVFSIDQRTGALTPQLSLTAPLGAGAQPRGMAMDSAGHLYVVLSGPHTVAQYSMDPTTGALAQIAAPINTGTSVANATPDRIVITPSGAFAYVANMFDTSIQSYTITPGSGALALNGAPTNTGAPSRPLGLAIHPSGQFLVATMNSPSRTTDNVVVYRIGATGLLTQVAAGTASNQPTGVTVTPYGDFVYVSNFGSASVTKFAMNASTGELSARETFATGSAPQFLMSRLAPVPEGVPAASPWSLAALGILLAASSAFVWRKSYLNR